MPYYDGTYYPDNLEFPWKKSSAAALLGMVATGLFLPVGWLGVAGIGVGIMGASFIRNRFVRYSLDSYIAAGSDQFGHVHKLDATENQLSAMNHGVKAAQSTWEYIKSFNPLSSAFRHWFAFSAGFGAKTATDYPHAANEHLLEKLESKLKENRVAVPAEEIPEHRAKPKSLFQPRARNNAAPSGRSSDEAEVIQQQQENNRLEQQYKMALKDLRTCAVNFGKEVQFFPALLGNAQVLNNYFNLTKLQEFINGLSIADIMNSYEVKGDLERFKVQSNDPDQLMVAFQKYAQAYFRNDEIAIQPKETAKRTLRL